MHGYGGGLIAIPCILDMQRSPGGALWAHDASGDDGAEALQRQQDARLKARMHLLYRHKNHPRGWI